MAGLTEKQKQLFDFIKRFTSERGFTPSYEQMAEGVGLASKGNIARLLNTLQDRGYIKKGSGKRARSLEVIDRNDLARFSSMELRRELLRRSTSEMA